MFRVAWGARSWPQLFVYSRNAPVISKLMSARVGQDVSIATKNGEREYKVLEVTILTRHPDDHLRGNYDNFAYLDYALNERGKPQSRVPDVRDWVAVTYDAIIAALDARRTPDQEPEEPPEALTAESKASLGDRFFMDPLEAQEEVMGWSAEGHVLVEGVAGSGKTSIALGRSARIFMERTEGGDLTEFTPATGVGYVLSEQLVGYLENLRNGNLNLEKMPVKSYFRLRQELLAGRRVLVKGVKRVGADGESDDLVVGTTAWVEAAEELLCARIRDELLTSLPTNAQGILSRPSERVNRHHWEAIAKPWSDFLRDLPSAFTPRGGPPQLEGSLERVDVVRGEFAARLEKLPPWDTPRFRDDRRKISQFLRDSVENAYEYAKRYFEIVTDPIFAGSVEKRLGHQGYERERALVEGAIHDVRQRAREKSLSNGDIDCLLLIAHRASIGYRGRDGAKPITQLGEFLPYRTHVFIDEVQDFNQVQVRLMAAQSDPKIRSVTAVGDFAQRLSGAGITTVERSGLSLAGERTLFLGTNKRQTARLHALSYEFRVEIQGDRRSCQGEPPHETDQPPFLFGEGPEQTVDGLRTALITTRETFPHFTMAVLCPNGQRARELEEQLHHELWAVNILSRVSDGVDASKLCDAFHVHFTTPLQAKGLEFDSVFVVDLDAYDLGVKTDQAAVYVALSRACHRLGFAYLRNPQRKLSDLLAKHCTPTASGVG